MKLKMEDVESYERLFTKQGEFSYIRPLLFLLGVLWQHA